ncbi:MAG TPA: hypothetical protein CFH82_03500 [Sulfurospirillum sp. UBA12182]|nr:MAG TPA: hypothetical protein CFH82_03500 [Sulfurospirillum sp. UBA12182]
MIKKFFIGTTILLGLVIVGLVVTISMIDFNKYKPQLSQQIKEKTGYELNIAGDISLSFSPVGLHVKDISIAKVGEKPFAKLQDFGVAIEVIPFLFQEIKVDYLLLSNLDVQIIKEANGKFNFEVDKQASTQTSQTQAAPAKEEKASIPLVNVDEVRIENVNLVYKDLQAKSEAKIEDFDLLVQNIGYDAKKEPLKALSFVADAMIKKLQFQKYSILDIKSKVTFKEAVATLDTLGYTIFGSKASGNAKLDLNFKNPKVDFSQNIPQLKLENFSKEILETDLLTGVLSLQTKLSTVLGSDKEMKKALSGELFFEGKGVGLKGYDIDKMLGNYDKSQNIDMVDIGSFLVAGPVGFALSKSSDGVGAYSALKGGSTLLKHLHVKLDVTKGTTKLSDVALATGKNRVALKGALELVNEKFLDLKVGILDKKGCAKYSQSIEGTFSKPSIKLDENAVKSVVNMASSLFGKSKNLLGTQNNDKCTVFYNGVVAHP